MRRANSYLVFGGLVAADDASVTRTITVNLNYEALSVADTLVSSGAGGWRGFLQIPHDLAVDADGSDATIAITDPKTAHKLWIVLDSEWFKGFRVYSGKSDLLESPSEASVH